MQNLRPSGRHIHNLSQRIWCYPGTTSNGLAANTHVTHASASFTQESQGSTAIRPRHLVFTGHAPESHASSVNGHQNTRRSGIGTRSLQHQRRYQHSSSKRHSTEETGDGNFKDDIKPQAGGLNTENYNLYGPHKEYFQTPGQEPTPDFTPYQRDTNTRSKSAQPSFTPPPPAYLQHHPRVQQQQAPRDGEWQQASAQPGKDSSVSDSLSRRFLRSTMFTLLFFAVGVTAGTALITYEYLAPMHEEGSEEEVEFVEDILAALEESSLIIGLREDGWREVDLTASSLAAAAHNNRSLAADLNLGEHNNRPSQELDDTAFTGSNGSNDDSNQAVQGRAEGIGMGRSMMYQMLTGSKGLLGPKMFHHPSQDYSIMVFFAGFGIDGWPDVIHGGMVTALLEEAVQRHIDWFHSSQIEKVVNINVKVDFKRPVQPGEIYAVLVPPAAVDVVRDQRNLGLTGGIIPTTMRHIKLVGLFMQMDGAPRVSSGISQDGTTTEHKIDIPGRSQQEPNIHAVAEVTMKVSVGKDDGKGGVSQDFLNSITLGNAMLGGGTKGKELISEDNNGDEDE